MITSLIIKSENCTMKHHAKFLMITNNEGKSTIFSSGTCPRSSMDALDTVHVHVLTVSIASGKRSYSPLTCLIVPSTPSRKWRISHRTIPRKILKSSKPSQKTHPMPLFYTQRLKPSWYLLKKIESASNTKVRQLHKPSRLTCRRLFQVLEFNGEIFTCSGEDSMTVFPEYIRDSDR